MCYLHKYFWVRETLVRSPDPLADGSDFFKVRRGPCLEKRGQKRGSGGEGGGGGDKVEEGKE